MLLGGTGCQQCGCVPCVPCDAVCSETAVGFEVVYSGNTTDGYLTWSGTANPVNAAPPVTGPYNAQITGNFSLPGDDFPCYARLRVWRNIFTMNPGATETPTSESVVVTCATGKIRVGIFELLAGESVKFGGAAPTSGDAITYWTPASNVMTVLDVEDDQSGGVTTGWNYAIESLCSPSSGSITARVEWTDDDIYHAIYGEFVECFTQSNAGGDCVIDCDGTLTDYPDSLTVDITNASINYTLPSGWTATFPSINGTYVVPRGTVDPWCRAFFDSFAVTSGVFSLLVEGSIFSAGVSEFPFTPQRGIQSGSVRLLMSNTVEDLVCGAVASISGSGTIVVLDQNAGGGGANTEIGTIDFDYEVTL